jgi:(methylthio)acryloyl-CoA hydratase
MKLRMLRFQRRGAVAVLQLGRPHKRNALSDEMVEELDRCIAALPEDVRALVLHGAGKHFCAGLDLAELAGRSAAEGVAHSRGWHGVFNRIQFGRVPVIAVMHGAVVGGGLELASTAHLRVAEAGTFYALPEGQRGIFVGGGASVRVPRLIGAARMADMMFTGRVYTAEEGQAAGISTYLVPAGKGLAKGLELADRIAANAPATNFALMHVLPRITEIGQDAGLLMESLVAGIAQSEPEAKQRMQDFLDKRAEKVKRRG